MNKQQKSYAIAKAQYDEANKSALAYTMPFYDQDLTDDELIAIEETAEAMFKVIELENALEVAENALIEWAFAKVSKIAFIGEEKKAIEICYAQRANGKYRRQFVDMAFRLA